MKTTTRLATLSASIALLLPAFAFSQTQSGANGANGSMNGNNQTGQYGTAGSSSMNSSGQTSQYGTNGSSSMNASGQTGQYGSSAYGTSAASYHQVSEDNLKNRVTAHQLIGKEVVDRDGQKVGKVKDIGLTRALGAGDWGSQAGRNNAMSTASGSATMPATGSMSSESGVSSSVMGMPGEVTLFVDLDRSVGVKGDNLASIPSSAVEFDHASKQVKLQITRQELATNLQQSGTGWSSGK